MIRITGLSLLLLLFWTCTSGKAEQDKKEFAVSRTELVEVWRSAKNTLIIYPENDTALGTFLTNYIKSLGSNRTDRGYIVTSDQQLKESDLTGYPVMLIGQFDPKSPAQQILSGLPVQFDKNGFIFQDHLYNNSNDLIRVSIYPNPLDESLPVSIISGNRPAGILAYLKLRSRDDYGYLLWDSWGYQVLRNDQRLVLGTYTDYWLTDSSKHWVFDYSGKQIGDNDHFTFFDHHSGLRSSQFDSIATYTHRNITHLERDFGITAGKNYTYHIYESTEIKGLMFNNTEQSHVDFDQRAVHAIYEREFGEHYSGAEMEIIIRDALGEPAVWALEKGLSALYNQKWEEKGARYWAGLLYQAEAAPSLKEIINNQEYAEGSPIIMQAAAAMLVDFLIEYYGNEGFKEKYTTIQPGDLLKLEPAFQKHIDTKTGELTIEFRAKTALPELKGFNFAHEGYQIYNGYLGSSAKVSLEKMRSTGSNSLAIIPYSFTGELNKPVRYPFVSSAGAENDASVLRSAYLARELGMTVMLKPQIWSWNGWPGDVAMTTESDWQDFFANYERWIMHYALMAEMYEFDVLCIGVEFQQATLSHPEEWVRIFEKVRSVYQGYITYAANWGDEFEKVPFWDKLDFISVNCYYPLSKKENPSDEELRHAFEAILDKLEKVDQVYDKPLLITEIGFKSIKMPWLNPHADADHQEVNEEAQRRCYAAMFQALEDEPWVKGIYLWQWPSYLDYIHANPKGFTPAGKLAEKEVIRYFSRN